MINYLVYKTKNKLTNKEYIGVHKQEGIEFDGYLGSGYSLKLSIDKYGVENFIRETLYSFEDSRDAYLKESELVDEKYINRSDTYNISLGGSGAPSRLNSKESIEKRTKTYIERGFADCKHMVTPLAINKAKATRKLNGTDQCKWMNNPEVQKRAVENARNSVINNSLNKYPILLSKCKLLSPEGEIVIHSCLYDISVYLYGRGRAVSFHSNLVRLINKNEPFKRGTYKGFSILLLESAETKLDSMESREGSSEPVADNT